MKVVPYSQNDYTPVPTGWTKFLRSCVIWQFLKFLAINIKMTIVIVKSHKSHH